MIDPEIALIVLVAPVVSLLGWAASYLPESFTFLEANRNVVATGLIALGTLADVALALLLLVWASYVFVTLVILD